MSHAATVRFTVLADPDAVAAAAADRVVDVGRRAIEERGTYHIALSGGSTPKQVYPRIARRERRERVDWSLVEFFWGDERAVPPDHPESNFGGAYQMLLAQLPGLRPAQIHRMNAEAPDLDASAAAYEAELRLAFAARGDTPPPFDLIWLGMGPDGHTASLFPGDDALTVNDRWVVATRSPGGGWRMTLTYPVLDAAREVIVVATGADKAEALRRVRAGDTTLPAARLAAPSVEWIVDRAAAGELA